MERKGKERKGRERTGKERKERKGRETTGHGVKEHGSFIIVNVYSPKTVLGTFQYLEYLVILL